MPEKDDEPSLATQLAWEFVNKHKRGENPSRKDYLAKLPNKASRDEFEFLVNMDQFTSDMASLQADIELKESLSELPDSEPDIGRG